MAGGSTPVRLYLRFLALASGIVTGVILLGYVPSVRLGGDASIRAMLVACAVCAVASAVGGLPILAAARRSTGRWAQAILASMAVRLALVAGLSTGLLLTQWLDRAAFLIWVAISYLALLVADATYAVASVRTS